MKKLVLLILISGQIATVNADVVVQVGDTKHIFSDRDKDSQKVQELHRLAEVVNEGRQIAKRREQIKDELGLGELERLAVSTTDPDYEEIKRFRGANTDQLFSLFELQEFSMHWRGIAKAIGIVADEAAAKKLADFAASPFPLDNEATRQYHFAAREGAVWGLTLATRDQPMPWVREFLIKHADADQWIRNFGSVEIDRKAAHQLAKTTMFVISRMGNEESLAMLKEVKARHSPPSTVAPFSEGASAQVKDEELDFINMVVGQTQMIAEARAKHAK